MQIKQDERALLQLLLERDQSYQDIAGLLGHSETEVRERARSILTRLGGADPDSEVGLTDYLLGQADPIGRADAVRHLQRDPAAMELAREITTKLGAIAPDAQLPDLAGARPRDGRRRVFTDRGDPAAAASEPVALEPRSAPGAGLDPRQQRLIALLGSAGLIVIVVILAIAGVFSGDDDSASGSTADELGVTAVDLEPRGGSSAEGRAVFGQTEEDFPFVDLTVTGLPPAGEGEEYLLWLLFRREGDTVGVPFSTLNLDRNGNLSDRLAFPIELVPFAALATHIDISRSDARRVARLAGALQEANQDLPFLPYVGQSVLRGPIPSLSEEDLEALGIDPSAGGGAEGDVDALPELTPGGAEESGN